MRHNFGFVIADTRNTHAYTAYNTGMRAMPGHSPSDLYTIYSEHGATFVQDVVKEVVTSGTLARSTQSVSHVVRASSAYQTHALIKIVRTNKSLGQLADGRHVRVADDFDIKQGDTATVPRSHVVAEVRVDFPPHLVRGGYAQSYEFARSRATFLQPRSCT